MILALVAAESFGDKIRRLNRNQRPRPNSSGSLRRGQGIRQGQNGFQLAQLPSGGVDFSGCVTDPDTGFCCVEAEETVQTVKRDPILECTHRNEEKCHYTYITQFSPTAEEICEENFEKICQITFKQEATEEEVKKCYRPLIKDCNGQGEEVCQTMFESACTTRYIEKQPGKFVGDTKCEKLPVDICGAGCVVTEGPEECFDKTVLSLIDIPEEICDLNPQKTCKFQTRLVPNLKPEHECTIIPREICFLRFTNPEQVDQPLQTRWCLDPAAPTPGETYSESGALGAPVSSRGNNRAKSTSSFAPPPSPPVPQFIEENQISTNGFSQQNQIRNQQQFQQNQIINQQQFQQLDQQSSNQVVLQQNGRLNSQQQQQFQSNQVPFRNNVSSNRFGNQQPRQGRRRNRMVSHDDEDGTVAVPKSMVGSENGSLQVGGREGHRQRLSDNIHLL